MSCNEISILLIIVANFLLLVLLLFNMYLAASDNDANSIISPFISVPIMALEQLCILFSFVLILYLSLSFLLTVFGLLVNYPRAKARWLPNQYL